MDKDNFALRHLYTQQRHKVEDRHIRVNDKFIPDPASVTLTWKFYSKYKNTCDSCKNIGNSSNESDASRGGDPLTSGQDNQPNQYYVCYCGCCNCCNVETKTAGQSKSNNPMDNLTKYTELVEKTMTKTPQIVYKDLMEPPLTSMDYGWLAADMFTAHYDEADRKRFFRGREKVNFW